jgi:chemotaxis protein methyltransferase CheR
VIEATERFRALVAQRLGLAFDDGKLPFLTEVMARRLEATRLASDAYLAMLAQGGDELAALARDLTVGETYFFRNADQFRALADVLTPHTRILSAGCASGEEPYSIAMTARETLADPSAVSIHAIDVNPDALDRARRGRYTTWALRETSDARRRWFEARGREITVEAAIRASVTFQLANLVADDAGLWAPARYDVIFCRNVIMYFGLEQQSAVVARLARALAPGGYLFLGHAETLRGLSQDFHLRHTHDTFYYQRRGGADEPRVEIERVADAPSITEGWVDAIREAAARVEALTQPRDPRPVTVQWDLAAVFELIRRERFADALAAVRGLPPESARDADVLLVHAVLLVHLGQLAAAEEVCRRLLALDELAAGAHYVLALCCEGIGDREGARDHDQAAAYLDPSFAMPRLHLGLLARRGNDRAAARRELGQALVLLQREEPSRLVLFGGGFTRDALLALCRAELAACGGAS